MTPSIFVTKTCGQCTSLMTNPRIYQLQQAGKIYIYDLHSLLPHVREMLFKQYNPKRLVPFMLTSTNTRAPAVVGKDQILASLPK